ncbi:MAG: metallophosphoesterase [Thermoplasmata archaeon]
MAQFIHISDTHLGSRQYMMEEREMDFYDAFNEAIDLAIGEHVNFILHTGDLFDSWVPGNSALITFKNAIRKLNDHGIPFYTILGDHDRPKRNTDPAIKIFDFLGAKLLGENETESFSTRIDGQEILIAGLSNMRGYRKNQLVNEYRRAFAMAEGHKDSILLSHQAIDPFFNPDQCEAKYNDLPMNYSYLAFGHIHDYFADKRGPVFSYAGSTEIKSTNEIRNFLKNGKSVNLVSLEGGNVDMERIILKSPRYQFEIDSNEKEFLSAISENIDRYKQQIGLKKPLISLKIYGDISRESLEKKLAGIQNAIFRRAEIIKPDETPQIGTNVNDLIEYFRAFFKNDEMAEKAMHVYRLMKEGDVSSVNKFMLGD